MPLNSSTCTSVGANRTATRSNALFDEAARRLPEIATMRVRGATALTRAKAWFR
jgi:hypothetical protein